MSATQPQVEKGMPPATASNPPGADYATNVFEPRTATDPIDPVEKQHKSTIQPGFVGTGERPTYMGLSGDRLIWAVTFFATLGFSLFGYDQGLMSGIISAPQFNGEFPQTYQSSTTDVHGGTVQGTVVSVYEVGAFFGALFSFFVGDRLGRLKMMNIGSIFMIVGTVIACTAFGSHHGFLQFIISRVVSGFGTGMLTATIPSWVAECSKAHNRGFLICMEASTVAVGTVIAYWVDYGCSFVDSSFSWRFPIALQAFFAAFVIWGAAVMPQSPRWLITHGYDEEGLRVIAALAGTTMDDPAAIEQRRMILDAYNATLIAKASSKDLLKSGKKQNLRRMLVGASSQVFQQLGGCNAVIYYATILFEGSIGLERNLSLILGGVLAIVYAMFALLSFVIVERVGRRPLFLAGTAGQAVAMFITWACLLKGGKNAGKGAAFGLYFFIAWFGCTWLPLPWLYPAELNSQAVRTQANAISTMCNWIFNFLVVQVLPTMTASIGAWTFFLFAMENVISFPIIWLFYPETTGRTLNEIDIIFAHAHLAGRRPTLIADELPPLTAFQQEAMQDKYDIHGAEDTESGGVNADNVDLSLPPTEAPRRQSGYESNTSTRVPSISGEAALNEKTPPKI